MAILYGTAGGVSEIGDMGIRHCEQCGKDAPFTALVRYSYFHIWYLFCFIAGRDYYLRCANCDGLEPTNVGTVREQHASDNIPFLHRNGGLAILCLISAVLFAISVKEKFDGRQADVYIASPQANDLYIADLAAIPDSGFGVDNLNLGVSAKAYGIMRLLRREGDKLFFASSNKAFESKSDMDKKRRELKYDTDTVFALTAEEVRKLRQAGVIINVERPTGVIR